MRTHAALVVLVLVVSGLGGCASMSRGPTAHDIPRLGRITVDGKAEDWGDQGFRVDVLSWTDGQFRAARDLDARFRLAWDERGLLILATVDDDAAVEADSVEGLYFGDSVAVYYSDRQSGSESSQCIVSPGRDPAHGESREFTQGQPLGGATAGRTPAAITHGGSTNPSGYVLEILVPWENFGVRPVAGLEVALQLVVNDSDRKGSRTQAVWYPQFGAHVDSRMTRRVRLADTAGAPVTAAAIGRYANLRRAEVDVAAVNELSGAPVLVRDGRSVLARGRLGDREGRAFSRVTFPLPPRGQAFGTLDVVLGGRPATTVDLPDPAEQRARALMDAPLVFQPCVFSGQAFPKCDFEQPAWVEELIGPYAIDVTFYDREYNVVTGAAGPGRYGAVVSMRTDDGRTLTRYRTLFRQARDLRWWQHELKGPIELPEELGIDPAVVAEQQESVNAVFKSAFEDHTLRSGEAAVLLAGLHEMSKGRGQASVYDDPLARDRQWWVGLKRKLTGNDRRYSAPLVCPRPIDGEPAPVLRPGTAEEAGMKPGAAEAIDALLRQWAENSDEAFIACVARRGVIVLHKAYGTRDGKAMTTEAKSWMASLTKLIQGTCLMMLVDRGLVDLDARVDEYLPAFRNIEVGTPMAVRHLPLHVAGMWGHWGDEVNDFEQLVAEYYPHLAVGDKWLYNGMDLALASKIIEQVTGESLPTFYKRHLFDPLGCEHTDVTNSSSNALSTAQDMARIGQMLLNGGAYGDKRFFEPETLEKMLPINLGKLLGRETQTEWGVGCSWMSSDGLGRRTFGHGAASSATLRIDPENDLVISMTRNAAGRNFAEYHARFLRAVVDGIAEATQD